MPIYQMKHTLVLFLLSISFYCCAQKELPMIKAGSHKASIYLENGLVKAWNLDPREKPDVFQTPKLTRTEIIRFKTDSDSILVKLKPGEKADFMVLLNEKDYCLTRIQSPEPKNFSDIYPEIHDTIPFVINDQNTIYITAVLNGTDTLRLNFDTGTTDVVLTHEVLNKKIRSALNLYNTFYDLQIGKRHYKSTLYPAALSGHGTDGRFGWDLFDGYIVELNYDKHFMVVHSKIPAYALADKAFLKCNIKYVDNIFLVESTITQNEVDHKSWFLFDTGYERTAMLDSDLLKESKFPIADMEVIKKVVMKGAQGNEIPVITSKLGLLRLGSYGLKNVPVQVQSVNKPLAGLNIHILGNEVLKRFNTFLDFQNNIVYIKPNKHVNDAYIDQRKNGL